MKKEIDIEAFKKAGLSNKEIESVIRWLEDVENGRIYTEEEFYTRLEKRLFSKEKSYV